MKKRISMLIVVCLLGTILLPAQSSDMTFPVRGLCIAAPRPESIDRFITFINDEMVPRQVNTLILRIDFNYQFTSHPELIDGNALSYNEVKKLVKTCRHHQIRLIPQINLLGHQSWAETVGKLLSVYPQFDETPHVKMPTEYEWPNVDGLYCKSYCPLHPDVHKVVFAVVDEICDVFETDAFHAGMDEVFYIGHDSCSRCSGRDKAELFAGEVTAIRNHLALKNRELWTGMGMWEASMNNTYKAVDLIPRDVFICDWHYERADQTPVYFAMKGLRVATCPWNKPEVAVHQVKDMARFRQHATPEMKERFAGIIQTVWSNTESFMDEYYAKESGEQSSAACFKAVFEKMKTP